MSLGTGASKTIRWGSVLSMKAEINKYCTDCLKNPKHINIYNIKYFQGIPGSLQKQTNVGKEKWL